MPAQIESVHPVLNTTEIDATYDFFVEVLGFTDGWKHQDENGNTDYAGAYLGEAGVHMHVGTPSNDSWQAYLMIANVDEYYREIVERGAPVGDLADRPYGMRDFTVTLPGGVAIGFGRTL